MSEAMWRYRGGEIGPLTTEDLCKLFATGTLPLDTDVWCPAVNEWVQARTIPGFREAAAAAAISPPVLPPANIDLAPSFTDLVALRADQPGAATAQAAPPSPLDPPTQLRMALASSQKILNDPSDRLEQSPALTLAAIAAGTAPAMPPPLPRPALLFAPTQSFAQSRPSPFDSHPRIRILARLIDASLFMAPLALISQLAWGEVPGVLLYLGIPAIWLLCEAWLLCSFGTTPGKALLGVRIQQESGRNPTFLQSLERNVFTTVLAVAKMISDTPPAWTRYVELRARHGPFSVGRVVAGIVVTGGLIGVLGVITSAVRPAQATSVASAAPRPAVVPVPVRAAPRPAPAVQAKATVATATLDATSARLVGTWVIRATQKTKSDTLRWTSTLILRNDGTYNQRIRASDDLGLQRDDLSQDWSGTWSMVGNTLVENVKQSSAPHHPPGRWVYAISAFNPADITMRRQAVPKNLSDTTHPIYRYHKTSVVADSE